MRSIRDTLGKIIIIIIMVRRKKEKCFPCNYTSIQWFDILVYVLILCLADPSCSLKPHQKWSQWLGGCQVAFFKEGKWELKAEACHIAPELHWKSVAIALMKWWIQMFWFKCSSAFTEEDRTEVQQWVSAHICKKKNNEGSVNVWPCISVIDADGNMNTEDYCWL